jgi:hypothetical protein
MPAFKDEDLEGGTKINLPVIHDLNNGKILQPQFLISSIVPEGYLVSMVSIFLAIN